MANIQNNTLPAGIKYDLLVLLGILIFIGGMLSTAILVEIQMPNSYTKLIINHALIAAIIIFCVTIIYVVIVETVTEIIDQQIGNKNKNRKLIEIIIG